MGSIFSEDGDDAFWETMGQQPDAPEAPAADEPATPEASAIPVDTAPADTADTAEQQETDPPDDEQDGRPRDEKGRFVSQQTEQERLLAGKYRSPEELEAAHLELQRRLGQQGSELGELRRTLDERFSQVEQAVQQPRYAPDFDSLIDENPAQATMLAYQQGDQYALRRAAQAWEEMAPGAPALWAQNLELRQRLDQLDERLPQLENAERQRATSRGVRDIEERYGPISDLVQQAAEADIPEPVLANIHWQLEHAASPEQFAAAIENLALLTRAGRPQADTLTDARAIAREQALEAERAIAEATVASATRTAPEPPKKSAADRIGDEWDAMERPYIDGWNI